MPATAAVSSDRSTAPAGPRAPRAAPTERAERAERECKYCCAELSPRARKCSACGEWAVGTSGGLAAALLRLLGWVWGGGSLALAAVLWYAGDALRVWLVARAVDPVLTPLVLALLLHGLVALVVIQGLTVGVALCVLARLAPRRPRWWSRRVR